MQNEEKINNLPSFRLNCTKEQVLLTLPAEPSSFILIGLLMEEIETFGMQYSAGIKPSLPEKILENSSAILPVTSTESSPTVQNLNNTVSIPERKKQLNEIRKYMQNQDSFQVKDLTKQFTDMPYHSIIDLIGREKKNGKIYIITKGTYSKNPPKNSSEKTFENSFENSLETPSVNSSRNLSRNLRNDSVNSVDKYHDNTTISKKEKIREYILTLENFTSSEIQKHFSDVHYQSIILVIRQMKKENLIKSTSYGNYKVIAS